MPTLYPQPPASDIAIEGDQGAPISFQITIKQDGTAVDVATWKFDMPISSIPPKEFTVQVTGTTGVLQIDLSEDDTSDMGGSYRYEFKSWDADGVPRYPFLGTLLINPRINPPIPA